MLGSLFAAQTNTHNGAQELTFACLSQLLKYVQKHTIQILLSREC